jgi:hypothetical protein
MNPSELTSADVQQMARLLKRRAPLEAEVARINAELENFQPDASPAPAKGSPAPRPGWQGKPELSARGALKAAIIKLLQDAGESGLTVKGIAAKFKMQPRNVHVWFSSTGKKVKEIKKIAPARYAWEA